MNERIIRGLGCPSCGGSLDIREGTQLLDCKYCETGLMIRGDRGIPSFYVPIRHSKEEIIEKAKKWLNRFDKAHDLKTEAKFREMFPVYVPFWRVRSRVIGWVLGEEEKRKDNRTIYEPVERRVFQSYEITVPACDIGEFGVKWVDLTGDEILPFELEKVQQTGMTFGVLTTNNDVLALADQKFMEWGEASAKVDRISFSKLHMIDEHCSLVYYPLWILRYEYKNRMYQITADGESCELLYGRAPGNNLYRIVTFLGSLFFANLFLTTLLRTGKIDSPGGFVFVCLIALIAIYWGFRQFRYGGERKLEQKDKLVKSSPFVPNLPQGIQSLFEMVSKK